MRREVLDHGFVRLTNIAGPVRRPDALFDADSVDPAMTARISFDQMDSKRSRADDLRLLKYLMTNHHNTPIEMIEVWLEMKLPIVIARQFIRHRTVAVNETSARYATLPAEWYIPKRVGAAPTGGDKQGQSTGLPKIFDWLFKGSLWLNCWVSYKLYQLAIWSGVAKEHARMLLHLNHYTHWVWKQDMHNLIHFLRLRLDKHAQIEARQYAYAILELTKQAVPELMEIAKHTGRLG